MKHTRSLFHQKLSQAIVTLALIVFAATWASAQTSYKVISGFTGTNGKLPDGNLIFDAAGNLYGVTLSGGLSGPCGGLSCGTVFKLSPTSSGGWALTVLHRFTGGNDGGGPAAGLVLDAAGNLYGTAEVGGPHSSGVVFKLSPTSGGVWKYTVIHGFSGGKDGAEPLGGLTLDTAGNLYGTAAAGGARGFGVVFELVPTSSGGWANNILYTFKGINSGDGAGPSGGLTFDSAGNLYGAALSGGIDPNNNCSIVMSFSGCGVVFELSRVSPGWTETVLHQFAGADGIEPQGGLVFDVSGNLYGTATTGGATCITVSPAGCGVVYQLSPATGGGWTQTVILAFQPGSGQNTGGLGGANPFAGLTSDASGNLYGTTQFGGVHNDGVVFELSPSSAGWQETVLQSFTSPSAGSTGGQSVSGITLDAAGDLFGMAQFGGDLKDCPFGGCGVVFEITH